MRWLSLLCAALLAGCAWLPPANETREPVTTADPADLEDWRLDGRVAIQRANEGWSATLRWSQQADAYRMRLVAPLGRGTYELQGDADHVALRVPNGQVYTARDPHELMRAHLGWSIPVDGVRYWVRGIPAPHRAPAYERRDDTGVLTDLEQDGWRVSILGREAVERFMLPVKLYLQSEELKVRIVVTSWTLNPV